MISNNCPIKLYACLESIKLYVNGYNKIFVLYSASDDKFEKAYENISQEFLGVAMIRYVGDVKNSNLKSVLCSLLIKHIKTKYVALTVDGIIVKERVNFGDCACAFKESDVFGLCLSLGENITKDSLILSKKIKQIGENVLSWKIQDFVKGSFAKLVDMVVYERKIILDTLLRGLNSKPTKDFKAAWSQHINKNLSMACFCKSKAIMLTPLILQNKLKEDETIKDFLENKLLRIFNSGFKININTFYGMNNKSSNISYEVSFVPRANEKGPLWEKLKNKKTQEDKHFVFVIASYNNKQWYKSNLDSVISQKYKNYHVIYTDDVSPDGTGNLVEQYIKERKLENKILLIKNTERLGAVANIYRAIHMCDDKDIIIILDGDDWLAHDHVLDLLNKVYDDPNIWLTYGQYIRFPKGVSGLCQKFPDDIISNRDYRNYRWITSHLRTFYTWLYKKIKREDLLFEGAFMSMTGDLAIMFPMLEMAGNRFMFIEDVLHVYNFDTPWNDIKTNTDLQISLDKYIRNMPRYGKL